MTSDNFSYFNEQKLAYFDDLLIFMVDIDFVSEGVINTQIHAIVCNDEELSLFDGIIHYNQMTSSYIPRFILSPDDADKFYEIKNSLKDYNRPYIIENLRKIL